MKRITSCFMTMALLVSTAAAAPPASKPAPDTHKNHQGHNHKDQKAQLRNVGKEKLVIKVNGMVCAFCAQGIEKNFNKLKAVKKTSVDLDKMQVTVLLNPGNSLTKATVKKVVTDAGFGFEGLTE